MCNFDISKTLNPTKMGRFSFTLGTNVWIRTRSSRILIDLLNDGLAIRFSAIFSSVTTSMLTRLRRFSCVLPVKIEDDIK